MKSSKFILSAALVLGIASNVIADPEGEKLLSASFEAHGGLDAWKQKAAMEYEMLGFPLSPQTKEKSKSTIDLRTRKALIESPVYTVGFDGSNSWSEPGPKAAGIPSRFYSLGAFYFVGMPFVFGDPGVNADYVGRQKFRDKEYDVLKITFDKGIGHSDEDNYMIFLDPTDHTLQLIHHNVTELYPDEVRVTWIYDELQKVGDLVVPKKLTFHQGWSSDLDPATGASYTVNNVAFSTKSPKSSLFAAPKDSVLNDKQ